MNVLVNQLQVSAQAQQQAAAADEGSDSDASQANDDNTNKGEEDEQDEGFEIAEDITQVLYHAQPHIGGRAHPEVVVEVGYNN